MVGIPRSGGCHTCRRRRIRVSGHGNPLPAPDAPRRCQEVLTPLACAGHQCDQQRPNCRRCFTDGKTCEGYERWATFVNRTPAGLQRRQRMEEAIIPRPRPGPVPLANRALLGRFLDIYLPTAPHDRGSATEVWLVEACQLDQPAPVLRLALHALAGSRVGAADNSLALVNESQQAYGESLSLLHRILGSSGSVIDDQVLAASRCLMIFEVRCCPLCPWSQGQKPLRFRLGVFGHHQLGRCVGKPRQGPHQHCHDPGATGLHLALFLGHPDRHQSRQRKQTPLTPGSLVGSSWAPYGWPADRRGSPDAGLRAPFGAVALH